MGNSYLYIDGMTLWLVAVLYIFIAVCIVFWGMDYVKLIRKLDRLQGKYNREKADRLAAEWELESMKLKGSGAERHTGTFPTSNAHKGAVSDG